MTRPQVLKRAVTAVVLVSICSAVFISTNTRARAANQPPPLATSKLSPDLQKLLLSGNGDARVKVIVQSKPSSSGLLDGLLDTVGGVLVELLSNLNIQIV